MLEYFVTKIWRFLKKLFSKIRIKRISFINSFFRLVIEKIITFLSKKRKMFVFPNEHWGTRVRYILGWYERESVIVCKKLLRPGMNILDVGADIGYYSRLFSELVGPKGRVWAFEPHPDSHDLLKKNIALSKYQNIIPVKKAISDTTGKVKFFGMDLPGKHSLYDVSKIDSNLSLKNNLIIKSITIDDFLLSQGNPEINFIKIDIEGTEPRALAGMTKTVARSRNLAIIIEFNIGTLRLGGNSPSSFLGQLQSMGFKVQAIQPNGKLKTIDQSVYYLAEEGYINLLCLKNSALWN